MNCTVPNKVKLEKVTCNGKKFDRCRWSISNAHLKESLGKVGAVPQKSLILTFPNARIFANKSLIKHFIRGYWDGDGCLTYSNNTEKTYPEISVLGTEDFLTELKKYLPLEFDYKLISKQKTSVKTLHLGGKNAFKLVYYLYNDAQIYLDRKYEKYLEYCRLYEKLYKELETNIMEGCNANHEVNSETKKSESPQRVGIEPEKSE